MIKLSNIFIHSFTSYSYMIYNQYIWSNHQINAKRSCVIFRYELSKKIETTTKKNAKIFIMGYYQIYFLQRKRKTYVLRIKKKGKEFQGLWLLQCLILPANRKKWEKNSWIFFTFVVIVVVVYWWSGLITKKNQPTMKWKPESVWMWKKNTKLNG